MQGTIELTTNRLRLRRYRMEDAGDLYEQFGRDPKMYEYSGWNPYASVEMAEKTVREFIDRYSDPSFYGWAIEHQGNLIGTIGAYDYDRITNQIEVGLSIERMSWGKGFAGEALRAVLEYLTKQEGIETVTAWCAEDNIGSLKAMRKAGMEQTERKTDGLKIGEHTYDQLFFRYTDKAASH